MPGWHHIWDGLIRYGLESLPWFKGWLHYLKAVNNFCRGNLDEFGDELQKAGLWGAKLILRNISFTTFAARRWRKISKVSSTVTQAMEIFLNPTVHVCLKAFMRRLGDEEFFAEVTFALSNERFMIQLKFVSWFSHHLCMGRGMGEQLYVSSGGMVQE